MRQIFAVNRAAEQFTFELHPHDARQVCLAHLVVDPGTRAAIDQARATEMIDKDELQPGDLVFFNTMRPAFSHVGIYVGDG